MVKPANVWEGIIWAAVAVTLVCAVVTALVQDAPSRAWILLIVAGVLAVAAGGERRRARRASR